FKNFRHMKMLRVLGRRKRMRVQDDIFKFFKKKVLFAKRNPRSTTGNKPFYVSRNGLESLRHIFFCDGIKRYPVSEFLAVCRRQFLIKRQVFSNERLYQRVKFWRTFFITPPV